MKYHIPPHSMHSMESLNAKEDTSPGAAARRGRALPPIQTTFNPKPALLLQRPRPVETIIVEQPVPAVVSAPTTKRRSSTAVLRGLFGRNRSTKNAQLHAGIMETEDEQKIPMAGQSQAREDQTKYNTPSQQTPVGPSSSVLDLLTFSRQSSPAVLRSKSLKKERPLNVVASFDPPPLFQAYPQSVKHAMLPTPDVPVDTILFKRSTNLKKDTISSTLDVSMTNADDEGAGEKKDRAKKHRRKNSGSVSIGQWSQKMYVLVTSGYLLQYAGEGSHDRLPEKIMRLGKDSAAFASDALPGRHWVLQVSQASDENGKVTTDKSFFAKLGLGSATRKSTSNFLLVLDSPEDMSAWLVVVRKEIEALGGKRYQPDTDARKGRDEVAKQLRERPSRRFLVTRDPNQFLSSSVQSTSPGAGPWAGVREDSWSKAARDASSVRSTTRTSITARRSVDAPSLSNVTVSTEQAYLDQLRKFSTSSSTSAGERTTATSQTSSPAVSPAQTNFVIGDSSTIPSDAVMQRNTSFPTRRQSLQPYTAPKKMQRRSLDAHSAPQLPRPHPFITSGLRHPSPPTTNFSIPSFSKRYSGTGSTAVSSPSITAACARPQAIKDDEQSSERPISVLGDLPAMTSRSRSSSFTKPRSHSAAQGTSLSHPISSMAEPRNHVSSHSQPPGKPDHSAPRRLSSLQYALGVSPSQAAEIECSPRPPLTTALPALPSPSTTLCIERTESAPTPQKHNLRRPASMQVRSDPSPHAAFELTRTNNKAPVSTSHHQPPTFTSSTWPRTNHPLPTNSSSTLRQPQTLSRRSMPQIGLPPRAPPPNYPLPDVPPILISPSNPYGGQHTRGVRAN